MIVSEGPTAASETTPISGSVSTQEASSRRAKPPRI